MEANTLMAQLKLSLNANEHDAEEGQNAHLQQQMLKVKSAIAKADEIKNAESPRMPR